ncbi:MAG: hypothetical protein ABJH06_01285 [Paraglaciecola sp.]|uniref:hypothetical protein n=1 Tax=Paraglaciecola sp. TaxID=1920173 RepID=UPI003298CD13
MFGVSILIVYDSLTTEDSEDLLLPLYFFSFVPVLSAVVAFYTYLKHSNISKWVCSLIFSILIVVSSFFWYLAVSAIEGETADFNYFLRMSGLLFLFTPLLYLQLPWKNDA